MYTTKQMGDACEMLVAAELTLAGIPAMKVPDCWPGYDVVAQFPEKQSLQKISVKSCTFKKGSDAFVGYSSTDDFDWLAIVIVSVGEDKKREIFIIPRNVAEEKARSYDTEKMRDVREYRIDEIIQKFSAYENNFQLSVK